jgi:hypothetical protein
MAYKYASVEIKIQNFSKSGRKAQITVVQAGKSQTFHCEKHRFGNFKTADGRLLNVTIGDIQGEYVAPEVIDIIHEKALLMGR